LSDLVAGVDERLRDEVGLDRLAGSVLERVDLEVLDVDDPREAAHPVEEEGEVVVRAIDRDLDRPFRVEVLLHEVTRLEGLQREIALARQRLDALDELFRVPLGGKDLEELRELELEALDLLAELRELALGGAALGDLLVEPVELDLLVRDLLVEVTEPGV